MPIQILGIPLMRVAGVEADDVIGTVATRAHADGFVVAIASPDKVICPRKTPLEMPTVTPVTCLLGHASICGSVAADISLARGTHTCILDAWGCLSLQR